MKKTSYVYVALSLLFAIIAASPSLFAQSDLGSISGFVKDPSGAVITNAKVTVRNQSGGVERSVNTNESGYFTITNIPAGFYAVSVEASGFQRYASTDNKLDPAAHLTIDIPLAVGSSTQTVQVAASAATLQTESATVQETITRQQIDSLELNGRNPVGLAALVPGARSGTLSSLNFNLSQGPANFNGSRNPENLITFDGAPGTRTRSNGTSIGAADVDSTQEVQILTSNYAPEYGRSSGAQIRITTKTGGSQFHGAVYEYLRNTALNANTWARNAIPLTTGVTAPIHYNQFGYNIGGPIYIPNHFNTNKSKVFFYFGQEWVKYHFEESGFSAGQAGLLLVPSVKMRQGDFSELLDPSNPYSHKVQPIKDPLLAGACTIADRTACFPGNIIPADRLSPAGVGILNAWPVPNLTSFVGGGNWFTAKNHTFDQRKDTIGVDVNITDNHRIRFRANNF